MASQSAKFKVGLFVSVGVLIAVGLVVWLGASTYFRKSKEYVTFFNESVQGLQIDSLVKYRGVTIGRVKKIGVAPDYNLIEVVMQIDFQGDLEREVEAQLKTVGITGIVFIGLDRRAPKEPDLSPKIRFASEFPIIPSRPSEMAQILSVVHEVVNTLNSIDFKSIAASIKNTVAAMEQFFDSSEVNSVVGNLRGATANLDKSLKYITDLLASGQVADTIKEARATLAEARTQLKALDLGKLSAEAGQLVRGVQKKSQVVVDDLASTAEVLRRTAETLERMVQRLEANPSQLFFGRPPPARGR